MRTLEGEPETVAPTFGSEWSGNACPSDATGNTSRNERKNSATAVLSFNDLHRISVKNRPAYALGEKVINKQMNQAENPDALPRSRVDRDLRSNAQLHELADPDQSRINVPVVCPLQSWIMHVSHGKFSHNDHPVKWSTEPDVLHERLEVHEDCTEQRIPSEHDRITFRLLLDIAGFRVDYGSDILAPCRKIRTDDAGDRKWPEEFHRFGKVTKPLSKEERRRNDRKRFRANAPGARTANLRADSERKNGLMLRVRKELVFDPQFEIPEPAFWSLPLLVSG